jgi:methyl-accepting chemotaxis protein
MPWARSSSHRARSRIIGGINVAVEAVGAEETGRGGAVVATELRSLAQKSAQAARDIAALVKDSAGSVESGVSLVVRTGEAFNSIVSQVAQIPIR